MQKQFLVVLLACAIMSLAAGLEAATYTWNAGGGSTPNADPTWSNGANWEGGVAPPAGSDIVLNSWVTYHSPVWSNMGNMLLTLDSSKTIGNLSIDGWWDGTNTINCATGHTYTLTVSGNLTYDDYDMNTFNGVTLTPVMNIQGQLLGITEIGRGNPRGDAPDEFSNPLYFAANGNTIGGGINAVWETFSFAGNGNTFNGGITLWGFNAYGWRNRVYQSAGVVSIAGSGNTFGAGAINLNQFGSLILQTPQNLGDITAINFNGGNLRLMAAMTALPAGMSAWNVNSGQLIVGGTGAAAAVLGSLPVNLGGTNTFGAIVGCEYMDSNANPNGPAGFTNAIRLNGNGGILDVDLIDFGGGGSASVNSEWMNFDGAISGSGLLIKNGAGWTRLNNSTPNSYSGGTVVTEGRLMVGPNTSLGAGNVTLTGGGGLTLTSADNLGAGAKVVVKQSVPLTNYSYSFERNYWVGWISSRDWTKLALAADVMPAIDSSSNGVLWLDCTANSGGAISNALSAAAPGDGTMFLGGGWAGGSYNGDALAPGAGNTYRFGYSLNGIGLGSTCLVGDANVLDVGNGASSWATQTFTGKLTVKAGVAIDNWNGAYMSAFGPTTLGSQTGNVELDAGAIYFNGGGAVHLVKNDMSYNGTGGVMLYSLENGTGGIDEFDVTSLTRTGKSFFYITSHPWDTSLTFGGPTGKLKFNVTGGLPMTNGMVAPYMVFVPLSSAGGGDFMSIDPTDGFAQVSYVTLPATGGAGTELAASAGQTLSGPVNVWALKATGAISDGQTVTLGSGGLILADSGGSTVTHTANFKAGNGTADLTVFANGGNWGGAYDSINGTIQAGALVKGGPGMLSLGANNTGTLTGDIHVDQGYIRLTADNQLGAAANTVHLNGGGLYAGAGFSISSGRSIKLGVNGGVLSGDSVWLDVAGTIADEAPGAGPLYVFAYATTHGANTYSGGTVVYGTLQLMNGGTAGTGPITIAPGGTVQATTRDPDGSGFCSLTPMTLDQSHSVVFINGSSGSAKFVQEIANAYIGALEGDGDYQFGQPGTGSLLQSYPTLTVGALQSSDFYGRILQPEGNRDSSPWGRPTNNPGYAAGQGSVIKTGNTTLTLWGQNSWMGTTTINQGTLRINGSLASGSAFAGGDVTVNNTGTLDGMGMVVRNVTVNPGGALAGGLLIDGNVASTGAINAGGTINGNLVANAGTIAGTTAVTGNVTVAGGATVTGTHVIGGNVAISSGSFTATAGTTIGSLNVSGTGALAGSSAVAGTVQLDSGAITGTHAFGGNYTQSGGSLGGASTFGSSGSPVAVTINSGSFSGPHTIHGSFTTGVGSNAVLATHNGDSASTLTVIGNVSLDHTTTLNFNLGAPGTIGGGVNDLIDVTGNVSLDGTLNVTGLTYFGQGTYTLLTYTGTLTNNLTLGTMPTGGYTYTFTSGTFHAGTVYELNLSVVMPFSPGDTNHDGVLNSLDIDAIYHNFNAAANSQWKVTTDGLVVGQQDVTYELRKYFLTNYGDANLDNATDFPDFQTLLDHWQASGSTIGWAQGDFNGDYSVDFLDFQKLLDYWNPGGWHYAPMATPEPATLCLLGLGGLAMLRRRNSK